MYASISLYGVDFELSCIHTHNCSQICARCRICLGFETAFQAVPPSIDALDLTKALRGLGSHWL